MHIKDDWIYFSDGNVEHAPGDIVGLSGDLLVCVGADGSIPDDSMTRERRIELAKYMIEQWSVYLVKQEAENA